MLLFLLHPDAIYCYRLWCLHLCVVAIWVFFACVYVYVKEGKWQAQEVELRRQLAGLEDHHKDCM